MPGISQLILGSVFSCVCVCVYRMLGYFKEIDSPPPVNIGQRSWSLADGGRPAMGGGGGRWPAVVTRTGGGIPAVLAGGGIPAMVAGGGIPAMVVG
ncbi:unnamed protein product [Prunus brigantina]